MPMSNEGGNELRQSRDSRAFEHPCFRTLGYGVAMSDDAEFRRKLASGGDILPALFA